MESLFRALLSNTAFAAALGLVAAGVFRYSRRPAVAHALWVVVLVKLLTPPVYWLAAPWGDGTEAVGVHDTRSVPVVIMGGVKEPAVRGDGVPMVRALGVLWGA